MYQRFSPRVDAVVKRARAIARDGDQEYLGTEHVLLAILQEGTGVGAKLLNAAGIDEYRLKAEIDKLVKKSMEETWVFGNLPGSPHLKSTVAHAVNLAQQLEAKEVCTEHLVLAMLKEKGSVAELALRSFGMSYDTARDKVTEI
ncbi:MAG: Clp protease N-terminal domain-containing protein [Phycisphaerae bacterium]